MGSIQILGGVQRLIFKKALCLEASLLMNSQFIQISYYEWLQNNQMYLEIPPPAISIVQTSKNLAVPNIGWLKNLILDIWITMFTVLYKVRIILYQPILYNFVFLKRYIPDSFS